MTGTFSVAMCTYNGARYLGTQLESIAAQTRLPNELVICDDASSDDTLRIIERFASSISFPVRIDVNTRTLGSTKNFEKVIGLCNEGLIALADQDDVWLPHKLETLEAEFESRPNVGLVFSDADVVDENLRSVDVRLSTALGFGEELRHKLKSNRRLDVLLHGWTVTGATMAFRSKFRTLVLPIPDDLPMIHDGWIAAVIGTVAEISFIEQPLVKYRQHDKQQVGAPNPSTTPQQKGVEGLREAMNRRNRYEGLISIGEKVRARLVERGDVFNCTAALHSLDGRIYHFRTRFALPKNKLKRLAPVLKELASRRYHLYSKGLDSAVKDLLT